METKKSRNKFQFRTVIIVFQTLKRRAETEKFIVNYHGLPL